MGFVHERTDGGEEASVSSLPFVCVTPSSGLPEHSPSGQWYVRHRSGQRYRGVLRLCKGCGVTFLSSNGTKKTDRNYCTPACGTRNAPTQKHRSSRLPLGATKIDAAGYVRVKVAENVWARQHRLVMESIIGRPLAAHETVHHLDGNRANNHPENLQLRTGAHGRGQVICCLDCGSPNVGFECL